MQSAGDDTPTKRLNQDVGAGIAPWQPGFVVDRFRIVELLGQGAMGVVYLVEDPTTGARYAMKTLEAIATPGLVERFRREGRAQAQVDDHPNVVRVRSTGEAANRLYLVMDLAAGGDLEQRLRAGPIGVEEAARVVAALARGLAHVHRKGILHRDLKPSNVLFDGETPKLVDFGVARLQGEERLTRTGGVVGTPAYASPEQVSGEPVDERTDVYGLGAVLYHALTGRPPFDGDTQVATIRNVLAGACAPVAVLRPEVPPALADVVERALAREPAARFRSADELASAIEAALTAPRRARRSPRLAPLLLGGVVVAALVAWAVRAAPPPPPSLPSPSMSPPPAAPAPPRPAAAEPSPHWHVAPGEALVYRVRWYEHNEWGSAAALEVGLTLTGDAAGDDLARFEAKLSDPHFGVSEETCQLAGWFGPGEGRPFQVAIERAGAVRVTGLTPIGEAVYAGLDADARTGGAQGSTRNVSLGLVVRRFFADAGLAAFLGATLGAGPAALTGRPGCPWQGRRALLKALPECDPCPVPLLLTDSLQDEPGAPLRLEGEATYVSGHLDSASLRVSAPAERMKNGARDVSSRIELRLRP